MKKILFLVLLLVASTSYSQGLWSLLPHNAAVGTSQASFSIDSTAYFYTGDSIGNFYQYDRRTDSWTPKRDFPGRPRFGAVAFSITGLGYMGAGGDFLNQTVFHDFYRYDPTLDTWVTKANYPDSVQGAFSFAIDTVGIVASGLNILGSDLIGFHLRFSTKCYEYRPQANQWVQKANIPWAPRYDGFSGATATRGYCGLGSAGNTLSDFWEYNHATDTWIQTASSPNANSSKGFLISNKIFSRRRCLRFVENIRYCK